MKTVHVPDIHLLDTLKHKFRLSRVRSSDAAFYMSRQEVREAIQTALRSPDRSVDVHIHRRASAPESYAYNPQITVRIVPSEPDVILRLGCHDFSTRNSRRIMRWAGVKAVKP